MEASTMEVVRCLLSEFGQVLKLQFEKLRFGLTRGSRVILCFPMRRYRFTEHAHDCVALLARTCNCRLGR